MKISTLTLCRDFFALPLSTAPHRSPPSQCERELTKEELEQLVVGPKTIDFGTVSLGASVDRSVLFVNPLRSHIHVVFDVNEPSELKKSPFASQVRTKR